MVWTQVDSSSIRGGHIAVFQEMTGGVSVLTLAVEQDFAIDAIVRVVGIRIEFATSSVEGDRRLCLELTSHLGTILFSMSLELFVKVQKDETKLIEMVPNFHGKADEESPSGIAILVFLPEIFIASGDQLKVFDAAEIDVAGDDMMLQVRAKYV